MPNVGFLRCSGLGNRATRHSHSWLLRRQHSAILRSRLLGFVIRALRVVRVRAARTLHRLVSQSALRGTRGGEIGEIAARGGTRAVNKFAPNLPVNLPVDLPVSTEGHAGRREVRPVPSIRSHLNESRRMAMKRLSATRKPMTSAAIM